jgi:hypothetical protein
MKRRCDEPRCPVVLNDHDDDWRYCEAHRTDEKEYAAAEDFVRGVLDTLKYEVANIERFLEVANEPHPYLEDLAGAQRSRLGWLEDALNFGGNPWLVAQHAAFAGQNDMLISAYLTEHDLRTKIDEMKPDADRGRRSRTANPNGRPQKGPPEEQVRQMVQDALDRSPPSRKELGNARRAVFDALRKFERERMAASGKPKDALEEHEKAISLKEVGRRSLGVQRST